MIKQMEFIDRSKVSLIKSNVEDLDVAKAAWVSNNGGELPDYIKSSLWKLQQDRAFGRSNADLDRIRGLINFLYRERHMSPFEHGSMTFFIDTPIFVAREFMRHRTWSYNETSGRYKELAPRFYLIDSERPVVQRGKIGEYRFEPGEDEQYGTVFAETTNIYQSAWEAYQVMLERGVAREVARNVLPVGTMTQFYATANPRNIMQFLLLRNDDNALFEIREVAKEIEKEFAKAMPITYEAFKKYDPRDERDEVERLTKMVAQLEAEITYQGNIAAAGG